MFQVRIYDENGVWEDHYRTDATSADTLAGYAFALGANVTVFNPDGTTYFEYEQ